MYGVLTEIKGIYYFISHPSLWLFYLTILIPQIVIVLIIYVLCYISLFPIIAFFNLIFTGPASIVFVWWSVLTGANQLSMTIISILVFPEIQKIVFDAVVSREFQDDVVLIGKLRRIVKVPFLIKLGYTVFIVPRLLVLPVILIRALLYVLISSIPMIGPYIVIILQAATTGLQAHARYFALKGFDARQIKAIYRENTGQYMGFGIVANFLTSIPFLNIFFMFTNAIASALWVVAIEEKLADKRRKEETVKSTIVRLEDKPSIQEQSFPVFNDEGDLPRK